MRDNMAENNDDIVKALNRIASSIDTAATIFNLRLIEIEEAITRTEARRKNASDDLLEREYIIPKLKADLVERYANKHILPIPEAVKIFERYGIYGYIETRTLAAATSIVAFEDIDLIIEKVKNAEEEDDLSDVDRYMEEYKDVFKKLAD